MVRSDEHLEIELGCLSSKFFSFFEKESTYIGVMSMKAYGLEKQDRIRCLIKNCGCGDWSSKHPLNNKADKKNKRLRKHARREAKQLVLSDLIKYEGTTLYE